MDIFAQISTVHACTDATPQSGLPTWFVPVPIYNIDLVVSHLALICGRTPAYRVWTATPSRVPFVSRVCSLCASSPRL